MDFDFGTTKASEAFFDRHPRFYLTFERLMELANMVFGRESLPKNRLEDIGFGLGHTCREDFIEIVFLASNGYGGGAFKLFRGLYERALTLAYLVKYPDKIDRFVNFAAIQDHRTMEGAFLSGVTEEQFDQAMSPDTVAAVRERYKQYKPDFQITDCKVCKTTRTAVSWDLDVAAMVRNLGVPYTNIFLMGYAIPNLKIHATLSSAMADFDKDRKQDLEERAKRKRADGEFVLSLASAVFIQVMRAQNTIFSLGLEDLLDACDQDVIDVWEPYLKAKKGVQ
jgi:hypothetical protein